MNEQERRLAVRAGAAAAVAGAVLGTVVNVLHGDLPGDPAAALTRIAQNGQWGALHLAIIVTALLILVALLGLSLAPADGAARLLARGAALLALPGTAISITVTAIDGYATKQMADAWAASGDRASTYGDAVAVEAVQNALFQAEAAFCFGLPLLLIGLATQLPGSCLPRRTGWLAMLGGAGSLTFGCAGLIGADPPGLLFNGFAAMITLWALMTGIITWRHSPVPVAGYLSART